MYQSKMPRWEGILNSLIEQAIAMKDAPQENENRKP